MSGKISATVRMYRLLELGDCFLVTFKSGAQTRRMLIDCGSFRNSAVSKKRLEEIALHIKEECGGAWLDVVVGTHQHNDHLSGFIHAIEVFKEIGVEQVWLSWLDDPEDGAAREIGKAHKNLTKKLADVAAKLAPLRARAKPRGLEVLEDVLGFYAAKGDGGPPAVPAEAVSNMKALGQKPTQYLSPGQVFGLPGLEEEVRIHVLGPPRGHDFLYRKDPHAGESYDKALAANLNAIDKFFDAAGNHAKDASAEEKQYPFSEPYKMPEKKLAKHPLVKSYRGKGSSWRKIDDAWLNQAESLALYLDTFTNNSSLALAIELVESRKVLLFAADAQTGNWASWADVKWKGSEVTTDDLLARTVFYKVGHHASHNATLKAAFEKMTHPDLCALIPVHKKDPNIAKLVNGWKMPATNLFKRLQDRTCGRVLQMDNINPPECDPAKGAKDAWTSIEVSPVVHDLFIELEFTPK